MDNNNSAILLIHEDSSYASNLKNELKKYGYELLYVSGVEAFVDYVIDTKNCLIFIDSQFSKYRFLVKNLVEKTEYFKTNTIIYIDDDVNKYISYTNNYRLFAIKKLEITTKVKEIIDIANTLEINKKKKIDKDDFSNCLSEFLLNIGFSAKYTGFEYIKQTLLICMNNGFKITCLQRNVFPRLAVLNNIPLVNIERNLRWLIKKTAKQQKFNDACQKMLGYKPDKITTKGVLCTLLNLSHIYYQKMYNK